MAIRAGVIGVGYLGRHHARIYHEIEGVELMAVADTNMEALKEISAQYGCRAVTDYHEMLGDVDVVSIVTPTTLHHRVAMDCLAAGKDLLIEKPITTTVAEAEEIIKVAEEHGRVVQVGHLERYNPAFMSLSKYLSKLEFIESERVSPFMQRALDVDVTLDLMIHDIDIVMSLMGDAEIEDVRVVGAKVMSQKVDVAKAWVEFSNGVSALITASRLSGRKERLLKLYQHDSFVLLNYQDMSIRRYFLKEGEMASEVVEIESHEPLKEELKDFISCVQTRRKPLVTARDGQKALEVALLITNKIKDAG